MDKRKRETERRFIAESTQENLQSYLATCKYTGDEPELLYKMSGITASYGIKNKWHLIRHIPGIGIFYICGTYPPTAMDVPWHRYAYDFRQPDCKLCQKIIAKDPEITSRKMIDLKMKKLTMYFGSLSQDKMLDVLRSTLDAFSAENQCRKPIDKIDFDFSDDEQGF